MPAKRQRTKQRTTPKQPPRQLPLTFDAAESARRQADGTDAALYSHIGLPWMERASRWLSTRREPFTSEALVEAIGLPSGAVGVNANNATGATIRAWARRGAIVRVGYASSTRPESHGALLAVWQRAGSMTMRDEMEVSA